MDESFVVLLPSLKKLTWTRLWFIKQYYLCQALENCISAEDRKRYMSYSDGEKLFN